MSARRLAGGTPLRRRGALRRGYNIGVRLVDEFLAKAQIGACQSFQETAEVIAKVRLRPIG